MKIFDLLLKFGRKYDRILMYVFCKTDFFPIFFPEGGCSAVMKKRILALVLCLVMLGGVLAGCRGLAEDDKGAYIPMYLNNEIYDLDPANAYHNTDAVNVLSLLYETLFTLTSDGKIKPSLAKSYKVFSDDDGVHMEITLRPTSWSNGTYALTANDCIYSWRRLLDPTNSFAAASLLYDIKNARAYNQGLMILSIYQESSFK